jgi:hypothetical protein
VFWIVLLMLALTATGHFGVQPILAQLKADALPRQVMESACATASAPGTGCRARFTWCNPCWVSRWSVMQERGKGR